MLGSYDPVGRGIENLGLALQEFGRQAGQRKIKEAELGLLRNKTLYDIGLRKQQEQRAQRQEERKQKEFDIAIQEQQRQEAKRQRLEAELKRPFSITPILSSVQEGNELQALEEVNNFFSHLGFSTNEKGDVVRQDGTPITRKEAAAAFPNLITAVRAKFPPDILREALSFLAMLAAGLGPVSQNVSPLFEEWQKDIQAKEAANADIASRERIALGISQAKEQAVKSQTDKAIANLSTETDLTGAKKFNQNLARYLKFTGQTNPIALATLKKTFYKVAKKIKEKLREEGEDISDEQASLFALEYLMDQMQPPKQRPSASEKTPWKYRGPVSNRILDYNSTRTR